VKDMEFQNKILIIFGVIVFLYIINKIVSTYLISKIVSASVQNEFNEVLTKDEHKVKGKYE